MNLQVCSAAEVHAALPWLALAAALEAAFARGDTTAPLRHAHALSSVDVAASSPGSLLLMPAWSPRAIGVKTVTVMPGAAALGAGTVQASYLLLDRATGVPLALIDGEALTLRRTAATSALAARQLARADAKRLLLVGAGRLAPWMARAHLARHAGLREVQVWSRDGSSAEALARRLCGEGVDAVVARDLQAAVQRADVVSCATTSREPLVRGDWLRAGTHLDLVGGFRPDMREADDAAMARSRVVVDTYAGALAEAGELLQPIANGTFTAAHVVAELAELLRGDKPGRLSPDDITCFKSVGAAVEDLTAALLVLTAAPTTAPTTPPTTAP